jgi:hypothetical protein
VGKGGYWSTSFDIEERAAHDERIPSIECPSFETFSDSEWKNQYYVGQRFEFIMKDKGELSLKPVDKT